MSDIDRLIASLEPHGFKRCFLDAWVEVSLKGKGIRYTEQEIIEYLCIIGRQLNQ